MLDAQSGANSGAPRPVVVRVTNNLNLGGVQRRLASLLPRLTDRFEVHVVTYREPHGDLTATLESGGVRCHFSPMPNKWSPSGLRRMAGLLRELRADVVHGHSLGGGLIGTIAGTLAGARVRLGNVHHRGAHYYAKTQLGRRKQALEEALVQRLFGHGLVFVSRESLEHVHRMTGLPRERLHLIHNGLDFEAMAAEPGSRERVRASLGLGPHEKVAGFVGRLVEGKGVEFLLDFAARAHSKPGSEWKFVLVGGGDRLEGYRRLAAEKGLGDRLIFMGERSDVYDLYPAFDLYLSFSEAAWEGMPGVVLEACAAGLPVLSRESDPVREIAEVYPRVMFFEDVQTLDSGPLLDAALALPPADQAPFRAAFSIQAMAAKTAALYDRLLAEHP